MVCTLIDNNTNLHSGQNVVDSLGTAELVNNKFWPLWWHESMSTEVQTTLNHILICFYLNINNIFWEHEQSKALCDTLRQAALSWRIVNKVFL